MDWVTLVLRTVFVYFFILMLMRIMGKREIAQLSIFDLVVSIMIAELAVITVEDTSTPLIRGLLPIIVLFFTQIGLSYLSLKSQKLRRIVDGQPSMLVEHGEIREDEMRKQRYNLDDLLMQLRENKVHSLSQVEFAILEPSGKLSVFSKGDEEHVTRKDLGFPTRKIDLPVILIKDGDVQQDGLDKINQHVFWLKSELNKRVGPVSLKSVFFCSIDPDGEWYIDLRDKDSPK